MKISDALLYIIHKNGNKMTSYDLLDYIKRLKYYNMLEVDKDGISFRLTEKGVEKLIESSLL